MKNAISKICLSSLSAILLFSVCACGKPADTENETPKDGAQENEVKWEALASGEYRTVDEFSAMLVNNEALWSGNAQAINALRDNDGISAFFDKGPSSLQLAQKLYDAELNEEDIYSLYNACCKEAWWYNNIVVVDASREAGSTPFGEVDRTYFPLFLYKFKPEKQQVQEGVKKLFKNPDSVTITSEINFYYNVDDAKKAYDNAGYDVRMLVSFTARAKSDLGVYAVRNFSAEYGYPNEFSNLQQNEKIEDSIWRFTGTYTLYN